MARKVVAPIVAIILFAASVFLLLVWFSSNSSIGNGTSRLQIVSINLVNPVSVENSRWQLSIIVSNSGSGKGYVRNVFVNKDEIDLYGLVHGDKLLNNSYIATSVPDSGLLVEAGETVTLYIWAGSESLAGSSQVLVNLNDLTNLQTTRTININ